MAVGPDWLSGRRRVSSAGPRLVILRGNSGSGKSCVASDLQAANRGRVARIGQDAIRRDLLKADDTPGTLAVGLIDDTARWCLARGLDVVVEGILNAGIYGDMLRCLVAEHQGYAAAYYLDIPFEETLRRHLTKPNRNDFGESEMREWYRPRDLVDGLDESVIDATSSRLHTGVTIALAAGWKLPQRRS